MSTRRIPLTTMTNSEAVAEIRLLKQRVDTLEGVVEELLCVLSAMGVAVECPHKTIEG